MGGVLNLAILPHRLVFQMRRLFHSTPPPWRVQRPPKLPSRGAPGRCPVSPQLLALFGCLIGMVALARLWWRPAPAPLLIPRVIAQSWKERNLSAKYERLTGTWRDLNPTWRYTFFDDNDCLLYVTKRFPQYVDAYLALKKPVERSDLFRYLWLLGDGGMWADIDTEALAPLDSVFLPNDTLVVSVEAENSALGGYYRTPHFEPV